MENPTNIPLLISSDAAQLDAETGIMNVGGPAQEEPTGDGLSAIPPLKKARKTRKTGVVLTTRVEELLSESANVLGLPADKEEEVNSTRSRGRPKKESDEKATYAKLLVSSKVINSVYRLAAASLLTPQQCYERSKLIRSDPQTSEYYWRLVYSISFYQYRDLRALTQEISETKKYSFRAFSAEVGVAYFNLKRMFQGLGITKTYINYETFLYIKGINLIEIQLNPGIIEKAYSYHTLIQDTSIDTPMLERLFY